MVENFENQQHSYQQQTSELNWRLKFFFWLAASDEKILERPDCRKERKKHASIGAIVLLISLLASFTGGCAALLAFGSLEISIGVGIFWGLIVGAFDRLLITNIKKKHRRNAWEQFCGFFEQSVNLVPRMALAGLISFGISKVAEIQIFDSEISGQIQIDSRDEAIAKATQRFAPKVADFNSKKQALEKNLETTKLERKAAYEQVKCEQEGTCGTGIPRWGPVSKFKEEELNRLNTEIERIKAEIEKVEQGIAGVKKQIDIEADKIVLQLEKSVGLKKRLEVLLEISQGDPVNQTIDLFVTLIIIAIELLPILSKVLSKYSPYDAILEMEEEETRSFAVQNIVRSQLEIKAANQLLGDNDAISQEVKKQKDIHKKIREKVQNVMNDIMSEFLNRQNLEDRIHDKIETEFQSISFASIGTAIETIAFQAMQDGKLLPGITAKLETELQSISFASIGRVLNDLEKELTPEMMREIVKEILASKIKLATGEEKLEDAKENHEQLKNDLNNFKKEVSNQ